jgi:hypothetical protein
MEHGIGSRTAILDSCSKGILIFSNLLVLLMVMPVCFVQVELENLVPKVFWLCRLW